MRSIHRPTTRTGAALSLLAMLWAIVLAACAPDQAALSTGDVAPAFSLPSVAGNEVRLADYSGKPVLLYFHMAVG